MSKLICVDIDGTLVDSNQQVPESAARALERAVSAGHTLILCTGRSMPEIYPFLWDHGFAGIIAGAGAYVKIGDQVLTDKHIGGEEIRRITEGFDRYGIKWIWQGQEEFCTTPDFFTVFSGVKDARGTPWQSYVDHIGPFLRYKVPEYTSKGLFIFEEQITNGFDIVQEIAGPGYTVIPGSVKTVRGTGGEIMVCGVTKAEGMLTVAGHLGFDIADTIMIGDSMNDVEVLEAAGLGIAMGNAPDRIKELADLVTDTLDDDGLAKALDLAGVI